MRPPRRGGLGQAGASNHARHQRGAGSHEHRGLDAGRAGADRSGHVERRRDGPERGDSEDRADLSGFGDQARREAALAGPAAP